MPINLNWHQRIWLTALFMEFTHSPAQQSGLAPAEPGQSIAIRRRETREWFRHLIVMKDRDLMKDLALSGTFEGQIALFDLDFEAAQRNEEIARHVFGRPESKGKFKVKAVKRLADCLRNADFVVLSIEPGPMEARYADLVIPEEHGVIQPVGDSTGPGGILRGLRAVPVYAEYAAKIMEYCPQAWVINYTNPMTLCTRALHAVDPAIQAFGCCHEVFGTQTKLARLAREWFECADISRQDIKVDVTGINHFTWVTEARWRGEDLLPRLREYLEDSDRFKDQTAAAKKRAKEKKYFGGEGLVAFDLFRRFGALGAAGDRHLVEFVPWYARDRKTLYRWGVVCTPYEDRIGRVQKPDVAPDSYGQKEINPSGEEGVLQMAVLLGLGDLDTNVNVPNRGQAPDLPMGAVVETNAAFRHRTLTPKTATALPPAANALVQSVVAVQEMTLEAALNRDLDLAFQALLCDPLITLSTDKAKTMFDAMIANVAPLLKEQGYPV